MRTLFFVATTILLLAGCAAVPPIADHAQARALSNGALALMNQGDDAGAITLLNRVIAYNGGEVEDFTRRATAHASLTRHLDALRDLDKAIAMDPTRWRSFLLRAVTNQKLGRFDAAIADLTAALRLQPNDVELVRRRAYLQLVTERFDAAAADYQRLAEMLPRASTGPFGRAVALYLSGDWPAATQAFARQVKDAPADGIVTLWMVKASLRGEMFIAWDQLVSRAGPEPDWAPEWAMVRALLLNPTEEDLGHEMAAYRTVRPGRRTVGACEQALFFGAWAEIKGLRARARAHFESARASCPPDSVEAAEARTELARAQRVER